ncbi:MAG: 4Fe-4S dicluster domain-containing protein [Syntrophobacteraceae bacterium]
MTRTILRNLASPAATRRHPTIVRPPFEQSRGELANDIATCTLCGTCAVKCPSQCIQVDKKSATWGYDPYACVLCGVCTEHCPTGSLRQGREYPRPVSVKAPVVLQGSVRKKPEQR